VVLVNNELDVQILMLGRRSGGDAAAPRSRPCCPRRSPVPSLPGSDFGERARGDAARLPGRYAEHAQQCLGELVDRGLVELPGVALVPRAAAR